MIISKSRIRDEAGVLGRKTRVLFVEDDKVDQMAIKRSFAEDNPNLSFSIVGSVKEARKKLASEEYDIIIIDFMLADGTAFDVLREVGDMPSIIVTSQGSVEIAVEAVKSGVSDYLIKEPNHSHLLTLADSINNTIRNYQAEKRAQMLSQALMSVNDSVYITDMNDKIIYVNKAFQKSYGYSEEKIMGQNSRLLVANGESNEMASNSNGKDTVFHKREDNKVFPVSLSRSTAKDRMGNNQCIITVSHDMTERHKMEQALMEAIRKYSDLLASSEDRNSALEKIWGELKTDK